MTIQQALRTVLSDYVRARASDHLDSSHPLWGVMGQAQRDFAELPPVKARTNLRVSWSLGQGAWARIPWLALLDRRVARFTSDGVYVIYLFRQDMSGVYLTLNQGVSKLQKDVGRTSALETLRKRAATLRPHCSGLTKLGFSVDSSISLSSDQGLGADYVAATVSHKLYAAGGLPAEKELVRDLDHVLKAYDSYLAGGR